jgi:hypothetical protein
MEEIVKNSPIPSLPHVIFGLKTLPEGNETLTAKNKARFRSFALEFSQWVY